MNGPILNDLEVRELSAARDGEAVEELQLAVWGRREREVVSRDMLVALQLEGALIAGAFVGNEMVGFVFSFPTRDAHVQHSHMLAVLPPHRGGPAALALKRFQREWCLTRGVKKLVWTFDPLRARNANFNLRKLGATFRTYHRDLYGPMTGINAGTDSDRALAEWDLQGQSALKALEGTLPEPDWAGVPTINPQGLSGVDFSDAPELRFAIPSDFGALLGTDPDLARRWRLHGRAALEDAFARGYAAVGFGREGGNAYLLRLSDPVC